MTKKRFKYHKNSKDKISMIYDFDKEEYYFCVDLNKVCDILNEQYEQIQRLQESLNYNGAYITAKKKKGAWRNDLIDELRKSNQAKDDYIVEIDMDRKKLLKENKQLKHQLITLDGLYVSDKENMSEVWRLDLFSDEAE